MKIGVLLSGCGVYDGSEIHEAVMSLLAIDENGSEAICMAPNIKQFHTLNHIDSSEINQERNVFVESARIARGNIKDLATITSNDIDALVMPGGFGTGKNLTNWAFEGPNGTIEANTKRLILEMADAGKPIVGLCFAPVVIAKALENSGRDITLTLGTDKEPSPYNIPEINAGVLQTGAKVEMKSINEIMVDEANKIITAPCYQQEVSIKYVRQNSKLAIDKLFEMLKA